MLRRSGSTRRGETKTVTLNAPISIIGDDPRVDLLTIAWSVRYADAAPSMLKIRIDDVEVPVADLDTLIRSKQTGRLQDLADARRWSS